MIFPHSRILVFAKAPQAGRVKTRLIPGVGAKRAMELYRRMLMEVISRVAQSGLAQVEIHAAPDAKHPWLRRLAQRNGARIRPQIRGDDLGRRMGYAAREALRDAKSVLLIGADGVWLQAEDLAEALRRLSGRDRVVLGPADDGGYVLLGLSQGFDSRLFQGPKWGGWRVATVTRARLRAATRDWSELASCPDLDTPSDLHRWIRTWDI
ncbi:MAG: TIGR04282 family arsenosugar biosynthesis glycosyltransferase [Gammaproteobacteria bacterium]|nr:TIGR04282 family arsenosugar biosynthesis glycosyltransferase [Gammaproteobacteria bacterium]MCP5137906.1 TIGR04282 family arsenosugar biosynthesis glycosyltransferase [Gammaproteobacteria bacterium]